MWQRDLKLQRGSLPLEGAAQQHGAGAGGKTVQAVQDGLNNSCFLTINPRNTLKNSCRDSVHAFRAR